MGVMPDSLWSGHAPSVAGCPDTVGAASHQFQMLPRWWVVGHTLGWLGRCRAILVCYDKKATNYPALLQLACTLIWYRRWWRRRVLR